MVNSRLGLVTAAPSRSNRTAFTLRGALLLPKLRSEFAEFLDRGSLVHLGILYQPTCVGLRYGHDAHSLEAFLDSPASIRPAWPAGRPFHSPLGQRPGGFTYQSSLPAWRVAMTPGPSSLCPPIAQTCGRGTGICTRCPSPTPSGLGLGPPNPSMISIATEPSGIRWEGFSPSSRYSCQHSHSWPLQARSPSPFTADHDAPLPCKINLASAASVPCLSPGGLSAPRRIDQ